MKILKINFAATLLFLSGSLWAAPNTISFQGRLTDPNGQPIASQSPDVRFELFDVATGGNALWSNVQPVQTNDKGLFQEEIGTFQPDFFENKNNLYIEVAVKIFGNFEILSPRQKLHAVPFSFHADRATQSLSTLSIPDGIVTSMTIKDQTIKGGGIDIEPGSINDVDLATDTINSGHIVDGSVQGKDLTDGTISPAKMSTVAFVNAGWILPPGAVIMYVGPDCPSGFDEIIELRNRVPMGADTANEDPDVPNLSGQFLGAKDHKHSISHSHLTGSQGGYTNKESINTPQNTVSFTEPKLIKELTASGSGDNITLAGFNHAHSTVSQDSSESGLTNALPPAMTIMFCRKR